MGLETFLLQKKARGWHNDCLVCKNLSSSIHGCFVTFWKLIHSHAVIPRWLDDAKEFIQSEWSKQRDSCSLAHEIQDRGCWSLWKPYFSNYLAVSTWILNGSSIECLEKKYQPFSLADVRFGSLVNQISGLKSAWRRSRLCLTLLLLLLQVNSKKYPV